MTTQPEIHEGYHCPFCPDHKDYDFVWYELAGAYVCLGCRDEIACALDFNEQPTINEYNCSDIIDKLAGHVLGYKLRRAPAAPVKNLSIS